MLASKLIHQRCFNHRSREAAARCPVCHHFFCRECVTEHDDRLICASCLRAVAGSPSSPRRGFAGVLRLVQFFAGLLTASLFFYLLGNALLSVDSAFHEAAIWHGKRLDQK